MSLLYLLIGIAILCAFLLLLFGLYYSAKQLEWLCDNPIPVYQCRLVDSDASTTNWIISERQFTRNKGDVYLSIIIPCYNEEARIFETLQNAVSFFDELAANTNPSLTYELVVVDDGSEDQTTSVIIDYVKHLCLEDRTAIFKLPKNCGKGAAVKEGMLRSKGAICLVMDADGATEMSEFRSLHLRLMQDKNTRSSGVQNDADWIATDPGIVVGSRAHLQAKSVAKRSFYRTILMYGFHFCVWFVTNTQIKDTQCGFKLFTRAAVTDIFPHMKIRRWCFDVEVLLLAKKQKIRASEVPVKWKEIPGSKVKVYHILHMLWELGIIFLGYTFLPTWKVWKRSKSE